jgi:hypothetical protein
MKILLSVSKTEWRRLLEACIVNLNITSQPVSSRMEAKSPIDLTKTIGDMFDNERVT